VIVKSVDAPDGRGHEKLAPVIRKAKERRGRCL
jgi:hypothetical protein